MRYEIYTEETYKKGGKPVMTVDDVQTARNIIQGTTRVIKYNPKAKPPGKTENWVAEFFPDLTEAQHD